jgi:hypothetical protein
VHEWRNWKVFWVPDKKSIFSNEEIYDENDMDAPMLECDDSHECGEESKSGMSVAQPKKVEL